MQVSAARGLTRFIGRDAELEQLRGALERARAGMGQVVAVVGEPGVGKSRLVLELAQSHRTDGCLFLQSSAVSYGKGAPLLPVVELMKVYFGVDDRDDARRVREKVTGKLLTLDEGLRGEVGALLALLDAAVDDAPWKSLGAERQRQRTLEAVRRVLLRESHQQPLLLVFEDLHWIDEDTRTLLESLVESLPSHPVLLLVNYRPEYRHGWGGKTYYGQIRLDPLAGPSAEALLEALLGNDRELAPLTALLIARTEGNPFFLEESVRALAETGVLAGERGAYRLVKGGQIVQLPETVQALLAARIDRLPPEDKSLLQSASVIGTTVPLPLLQAIAERSGDDLTARLAQLQSAEFVYETQLFPEPEYEFKHTLTQEVAYAGLLHERRRALHAQVVAAIERLYPGGLAEHRDRLVYHAFRGELWTKAVNHLRDLEGVASPEEIGEAIGQGSESPGQLWWMGEHERALRAAERDRATAASFRHFSLYVVASCRVGQAHHALGSYGRAAEVFRQTVDSIQGELVRERFGMAAYPAVWARSWLAWTLAELGEFDEAARVADEAAAIAAAADHAYSRIQACWGVGTLHMIQGRLDRAVPALEQGLVSARLENISLLVPFITAPLGGAYALSGRIESGITLLEQSVEQAGSMRLVANHSLRLAWLGWAHLLAGRRDEALGHARRALDIALDRQERGQQARARRLLADIDAGAETPDVPRAEAGYSAAIDLAESLGMRPLAAHCRLGLGTLYRRAERTERARAELAAALAAFDAMSMTLWIERARAELDVLG